jgi:hypothetical protein
MLFETLLRGSRGLPVRAQADRDVHQESRIRLGLDQGYSQGTRHQLCRIILPYSIHHYGRVVGIGSGIPVIYDIEAPVPEDPGGFPGYPGDSSTIQDLHPYPVRTSGKSRRGPDGTGFTTSSG